MTETIWLFGLPATGKSTVGKHLAGILGMEFHDTDQIAEEACGEPIADYLFKNGEEALRRLEAATIAQVAGQKAVVALSGIGNPDFEDQIQRGIGIWLKAPFETCLKRYHQDENRGANRWMMEREYLRQTWIRNVRGFRRCAKVKFDNTGNNPAAAAQALAERIRSPKGTS